MKLKDLAKLTIAKLTPDGGELLNPKPILSYDDEPHESIEDKIARMIQTKAYLEDDQVESYEESQDFDITDEFDTEEQSSRYEVVEEEYIQPTENIEKPVRQEDPEPPKGGGSVPQETEDPTVNPDPQNNPEAS